MGGSQGFGEVPTRGLWLGCAAIPGMEEMGLAAT